MVAGWRKSISQVLRARRVFHSIGWSSEVILKDRKTHTKRCKRQKKPEQLVRKLRIK